MYLFAYGSLMNPASLRKTLPDERIIQRAAIKGFKRKMNAPFDGYAYLNIVPDPTSTVAGVLIPMSEKEFKLFSSREEGYVKTDVTANINGKFDAPIFAFIAPDIECALKVPRSYIQTCTAGMSVAEREQWIADTLMTAVEEDSENPVYEFAAVDL